MVRDHTEAVDSNPAKYSVPGETRRIRPQTGEPFEDPSAQRAEHPARVRQENPGGPADALDGSVVAEIEASKVSKAAVEERVRRVDVDRDLGEPPSVIRRSRRPGR